MVKANRLKTQSATFSSGYSIAEMKEREDRYNELEVVNNESGSSNPKDYIYSLGSVVESDFYKDWLLVNREFAAECMESGDRTGRNYACPTPWCDWMLEEHKEALAEIGIQHARKALA